MFNVKPPIIGLSAAQSSVFTLDNSRSREDRCLFMSSEIALRVRIMEFWVAAMSVLEVAHHSNQHIQNDVGVDVSRLEVR